jgi:hypothetical protein
MSGINPLGPGGSGADYSLRGTAQPKEPEASPPTERSVENGSAEQSSDAAELSLSTHAQVVALLREDVFLADLLSPTGLPKDEQEWEQLYARITNPTLLAELAAMNPLLHAILIEEEEKRRRKATR